MARKVTVQREDGESPVLTEVLEDEAQLQEIVKENPDLLPVDEFEVTGSLMVVGRETTLPSGAPDLLCLTGGGDLLVMEFKTGSQNSDYRRVLAQLLDYGSDLWQMSYEEFESTVAVRYFSSGYCSDGRLVGKSSIEAAARAYWPNFSDAEIVSLRENLSQRLSAGAFCYVIVAQRFTPSMEKTTEYLNAATSEARFYAVELVRFAAERFSAFEARMVIKPEAQRSGARRGESSNEARFLEQIEDDAYRQTLKKLLEVCRGLGMRIPRYARGPSIRLQVPDQSERISITEELPSTAAALESYAARIAKVPRVRNPSNETGFVATV